MKEQISIEHSNRVEIGPVGKYQGYQLNKELAEQHVKELTAMANQIPLVEYSEEDLLADEKGDRVMHGKWGHSIIVFDGDKPIAFIMAYEREAEKNDQYAKNSLYLSELAVLPEFQRQGIATDLLELFLKTNKEFLHLPGDMVYSVQTNAADWNKGVRSLYEELGFVEIGKKQYENRTDIIMQMVPPAD
jgi:ribosomal protein S18 acetylase RimI-like enzyme